MAYQANRNNQSNADGQIEQPKSKKEQNRENTKELAKDAGTVALQGLGVPGPLAGMATNKIAQNPLVNKAVNKASDKLHKNPIASKAINKVAGSPAKDAAMGAIGGKVGGNTGSNSQPNANNSKTGNNTNNNSTSPRSSMGSRSSFGKRSLLADDEENVERETEDNSVFNSKGKGKGTVDIIKSIKSVPSFLWPIIGWIVLIFFLIIIVLAVLSQFFPMFGVDTSTGTGGGDINYVVDDPNSPEAKFYDSVNKVKTEYKNSGKNFDAGLISGVYFIMNRHDDKFTFEDMDEKAIRELADFMFKDPIITITCESSAGEVKTVEGSNPTCPSGYIENEAKRHETWIKDEAIFKDNLKKKYIKKRLPNLSDSEIQGVVDEIYEYISNYNDLVGNRDENTNLVNNGAYWWPIGSVETKEVSGKLFANGDPAATLITSYFGGRINPITGKQEIHGAIDIAGGSVSSLGSGMVPVIAAKDGIVSWPTADDFIGYSNGEGNGGYGNYVVIQHNDGNYTLYAHLHANTITVRAGESVKQGQVIGMVGSSGNSTGAHLHFEIRVGENSPKSRMDPLQYVDPVNPRPLTSASVELIEMLHSWEGTGVMPDGENYFVYDDGAGNLTVGYGVAIKYNLERFESFGIDGNALQIGDPVSIEIVDAIEAQELEAVRNNITSLLQRESITLQNYQIDALISRMYNVGNINNFAAKYKQYGNTQALYDNYMSEPVTASGKYMEGLKRRREAEWTLFSTGIYKKNS